MTRLNDLFLYISEFIGGNIFGLESAIQLQIPHHHGHLKFMDRISRYSVEPVFVSVMPRGLILAEFVMARAIDTSDSAYALKHEGETEESRLGHLIHLGLSLTFLMIMYHS